MMDLSPTRDYDSPHGPCLIVGLDAEDPGLVIIRLREPIPGLEFRGWQTRVKLSLLKPMEKPYVPKPRPVKSGRAPGKDGVSDVPQGQAGLP